MARCLWISLDRPLTRLRKAFGYDDGSREVLDLKDRNLTDLWMPTLPWRQHPDFNTARWRSFRYRDPGHEVEMAAYHRSQLR
ncbi:hypothetical protein ACFWFZ_27230 [Streptomyces sp. NPDC060232]|uniref:hypothetical protein n=1 Tax=Streptomyces sp. NPDC060232 TaxID=3347079 RepID=UPI0036677F3C